MKNIYFAKSNFPKPQPLRRKTALLPLRLKHRLFYGNSRRNTTAKELDAETGLYYYGARYLDPKTSRWLSGDPALGEYIPSAPVNDEAKKRNGGLPGQGGVFNYVNLHLYHYAGNNPVKYVDPNGKWAFSIGVGASAGASTGGQVSVGVAIGYNKKEGVSIGFFKSIAGGSYMGASAGANINVTVSKKAESVQDLAGKSLTLGGSGGEFIVGGGDINISLDGSGTSVSGNIGIGVGSPGEGHAMYGTTDVTGDYLTTIVNNIDNAIKENIIYPILEKMIPQL